MESPDDLPNTVPALAKRGEEVLDFIRSLKQERHASKDIQVRAEIRERAKPSEHLLQAIKDKMQSLIDASAEAQNGNEEERKPEEIPVDGSAAVSPPKVNATSNLSIVEPAGTSNDVDEKASDSGEYITIVGDVAADDDDEAAGGQEALFNEPAPDPPWITTKNHIQAKEPGKSIPRDHAVLRFVTDGKVYCFGHLQKPGRDDVVQVLPWIRTRRSENPFYGIRVKFPRDKTRNTTPNYIDEKYQTAWLNFHAKGYDAKDEGISYTVEDDIVTDKTEFKQFLDDAPEHVRAKAKEAFEQSKLYRITFSYEQNDIHLRGFPNLYSSSVPEIQEIFEGLSLVRHCKTISLYMWMYKDLQAQLQYLYRRQHSHVSSLVPYMHKYKLGLAAHVQWGKILVPENETVFSVWHVFPKYREYRLIVGNGVAREKMMELEMIKKIRDTPAKLCVIDADARGEFYVVIMQFREFRDAKRIITSAGTGKVTWQPAPEVKPQSELAKGEHPARDTPDGWNAWVIENPLYDHGGDVLCLLRRPLNDANVYKTKKMPPVAKKGAKLNSQFVYYKIYPQVEVTKKLLNGLAKLEFKETKGDEISETKRHVFCGDQTVHRLENLVEGLSDADIESLAADLTPSQRDFVFGYCRKILNGIAILQGPPGSGKTTIIKTIVKIAQKLGKKVLIVTDSNAAADNVVDRVIDSMWITTRVHPLGLERHHLTRHARKDIDPSTLKPADPEHVREPALEDDDDGSKEASRKAPKAPVDIEQEVVGEGWEDDDGFVLDDYMLKDAKATYENAKAIMFPEDPRMKVIAHALWTWILKVIGIIEHVSDDEDVAKTMKRMAADPNFVGLRDLYLKSKTQLLNRAERSQYDKHISECASIFIRDASLATCCTMSQFMMDWSTDIAFDWVIVDEATVMTEAQAIAVTRTSPITIWMGDQKQLGTTIISKPRENPFSEQLRLSPFVRFIENGWPFHLLREVMRMGNGLEEMSSQIFYDGKLIPGAGTAFDHPTRETGRKLQQVIRARYPTLRHEPEGLFLPVGINITAESVVEHKGRGTSRENPYNASAVADIIIWLLNTGIVSTSQIGIATPYAAQVALYLSIFRKLEKDKPDHKCQLIRIGSSQWWQGKESAVMIVDLVCASNDMAAIDFVSNGRRLNNLITRQQQALIIIGDKNCTQVAETGSDERDKAEKSKRDYENRYLISVFQYMQKKGRIVELPVDDLSDKYVEFPSTVQDEDPAPAAGPADNNG